MAGPRPDDNYNPTPTVAPSTGMPSDTLSVRASSDSFGGQVGAAYKGLGEASTKLSNTAVDIQLQRLGLANEHAATAAEMQLAVDGGKIYDKYKSLEGLDAANTKDKAVQEYLDLSTKIRTSLGNPAAQRAYDQMATRRMSFTIQDMNSYAADQTKKAYRNGHKASAELSLDRLSRPEVVMNPSQFNFEMANVIHNANAEFTAPTYGYYQTVPAVTDPKTGLLKFEDSDQGRIAQAHYDNFISEQKDKGYSKAVQGLANDISGKYNINDAVAFLRKNEQDMSPGTYSKLSASVYGPYSNEQARSIGESVINKYNNMYQGSPDTSNIPNTIKELFPNAVITSLGRTPEHNKEVGGVDNSMHLSNQAADVVLPPGTTPDQLRAQLTAKGITPTEFIVEKDHVHIGWRDKAVGMTPTLSGGIHQSQVDFLGDHLPQIIQDARDEAARQGGDTTAQDRAAQRVEARVAELRSAQAGRAHSLGDTLRQKIMDPKNPITSMNMLDYGDEETRSQWNEYQMLDAFGASALPRMVAAQAQGRSSTYGTEFYSHLDDVLSGKVTNLAQIQAYFGGDKAPISSTGVKALTKEIDYMGTSQGQAFAHAEREFLSGVHGQVTGTKVFPGINPAILKDSFDKQMMELLPQIQAKRDDLIRQGRNPTEMFDPNNKDYVGKNVRPVDLNKAIQAMVTSSMSGSPVSTPAPSPSSTPSSPVGNTNSPVTYKTVDEVGLAWRQGKITKDQAYSIVNNQFGGFAPGVPKPH